MANLIVQPAAGSAARAHFHDTITNTVDLTVYEKALGLQLKKIASWYPIARAKVWGVTPGGRQVNVGKFHRAQAGDVVLFTGANRAYAGGVLVAKLHSAEVATQLWKLDHAGETWENMYLLDDVWPLDIPYTELRSALGYDQGYAFMGFNVLDAERSERAFGALGPSRLPFLTANSFGLRSEAPPSGVAADVGVAYQDVDESVAAAPKDPFTVDPNVVDRGLQGHATTQNALAAFLRTIKVAPLKPAEEGPDYDLAWKRSGVVFVAEVKSMTDANETKQLRLAIGQVLDYADRLAHRGKTVRPVIAVEHKPKDERWIDLCLRHGITLVWPDRFKALL